MLTHIIKLDENEYKDLYGNYPVFLRYYPVPDVYAAEGNINFLYNEIEHIKPTRVITTNEDLYKKLIPLFKYNCKCYEYSNFINPKKDKHIKLLQEKDLEFVIKNTNRKDYITKLYNSHNLYGYYINDELCGYGCYHIDGTIGLIFVKEEYRQQGIGSKIVLHLASETTHPYCHVKD